MAEFLRSPRPIAFAHRGMHSAASENTAAAFEAARQFGFKYIETDARTTSDGAIIAFHDANTRRTLGVDLQVSKVKLSDLQAQIAPESIVPLFDALKRYDDCFFNIDVKDRNAARGIYSVVSSAQALNRVCIGSFSPRRMRIVRRAFRDLESACFVATALEVVEFLLFRRFIGHSRRAGPSVFQLPMSFGPIPLVTSRFVRSAHARGIQVHVWTLNNEDTIRRAVQLDVDGIITDEPQLLKSVLLDLGIWL